MAFSWRGTFENWSKAYVAKNFWKVRNLFQTEEDALQECALIFTRCLNYYADKVDNPAWLMSLYKVAVINDWNTFARRDADMRSVIDFRISSDEEREDAAPLPVPTDSNQGMLAVRLAEASTELRAALTLLAKAPTEVLMTIFKDDARANVNRRLRRFCNIQSKVDLLGQLREILA